MLQMQSKSAEAVVRAIAPQLRSAEMKRTRITRPEDYTAYDFLLRAQEDMHSATRSSFENAGNLFNSAIEKDPHYSTALAWRAYWHVLRVGQGWSSGSCIGYATCGSVRAASHRSRSNGSHGIRGPGPCGGLPEERL